jgi:hypothetical protein
MISGWRDSRRVRAGKSDARRRGGLIPAAVRLMAVIP